MRKFVVLFYFISIFAQAADETVDANFIRDLQDQSKSVQAKIDDCAKDKNINPAQVYEDPHLCNPSSLREDLFALRKNIRAFALSTFDQENEYARSYEFDTVVFQILFEEMSELNLNKETVHGGDSGFGLCTGYINIGFCSYTPKITSADPISSDGQRFLRLLAVLDPKGCDLSYYPEIAGKVLMQIFDSKYFNIDLDRSNREAKEIVVRKKVSFFSKCDVEPFSADGIAFFKKEKLKNQIK